MKERKKLGLYLHIPFCQSKCAYCDFYSFKPGDSDFMEDYVSAMMLQMEDNSHACRHHSVDTVYFGGGTPSSLPLPQVKRLIESAKRSFKLEKDAEITFEVNPGTVNAKYLKSLRKLGINRLSIGLQSASNGELKILGRIHTVEDFGETYKWARDAGFENISLDLMYGLPGQTVESFMYSLRYATEIAPEHISLYCLKLEEGTPFFRMRDRLMLPGEDAEYEMYCEAVEYLESEGYCRYEMSNFAKEGRYSAHNLKYWNCEEYIGIGASAHSYFDAERYSIVRNAEAYISALEMPEAGIRFIDESRIIDRYESMNEYVMLRMRLEDGVSGDMFQRIYGEDFYTMFGQYLDEYVEGGFVLKRGNRYSFTTKGMFVSNYILSAVLDFESEMPGNG